MEPYYVPGLVLSSVGMTVSWSRPQGSSRAYRDLRHVTAVEQGKSNDWNMCRDLQRGWVMAGRSFPLA